MGRAVTVTDESTRNGLFRNWPCFSTARSTLGYPRAALFGFCVALVLYNSVLLVRAAVRSAHGARLDREVDLTIAVLGAHVLVTSYSESVIQ